jgi:flagellin-like protein
MYILNRHFNNRAVSQVIAALLLIAIAVAAAVLVYVFSIGLLGSLQGGGGQQVKQQVIMEAYDWTGSTLKLSVRNVGTAAVTISDVFIGGQAGTFTMANISPSTGCGTPTGNAPLQSACLLTVTPATTATSGVAYTIKIVTIDGAVFSYAAIKGQAS